MRMPFVDDPQDIFKITIWSFKEVNFKANQKIKYMLQETVYTFYYIAVNEIRNAH